MIVHVRFLVIIISYTLQSIIVSWGNDFEGGIFSNLTAELALHDWSVVGFLDHLNVSLKWFLIAFWFYWKYTYPRGNNIVDYLYSMDNNCRRAAERAIWTYRREFTTIYQNALHLTRLHCATFYQSASRHEKHVPFLEPMVCWATNVEPCILGFSGHSTKWITHSSLNSS